MKPDSQNSQVPKVVDYPQLLLLLLLLLPLPK
jgi:hypothetical protein